MFRNFYILVLVISIQSFCLLNVWAKSVSSSANFQSNQKRAVWVGEWSRVLRFNDAGLKIKNLGGNKFSFLMDATSGANVGQIEGIAYIKGNKAFFNDKTDLKDKSNVGSGCKITFTNRGKAVQVKTNSECFNYGGIGVFFDGTYKKSSVKNEQVKYTKFKVLHDAKADLQFRKLAGKDYEKFAESMQLVYEDEEKDLDNLDAKIISGCVRGICTYMRAIIMYDQKSKIWSAVFDSSDDKIMRILYYTNDTAYKDKLPKTIEKWIDDAKDNYSKYQVVYKNK